MIVVVVVVNVVVVAIVVVIVVVVPLAVRDDDNDEVEEKEERKRKTMFMNFLNLTINRPISKRKALQHVNNNVHHVSHSAPGERWKILPNLA